MKKKEENNYIISTNKDESITYVKYENSKGFKVKPKIKDSSIYNMVNVNEMVIINPSLIKKLINKKCNKKLEFIIKLITLIDEGDDSDGTTALALNEIERFRELVLDKYSKFLPKKEAEILLKKIGILSSEMNLRMTQIGNEIDRNKKGNKR